MFRLGGQSFQMDDEEKLTSYGSEKRTKDCYHGRTSAFTRLEVMLKNKYMFVNKSMRFY